MYVEFPNRRGKVAFLCTIKGGLLPPSSTSPPVWLLAKAAKSPMFTNVEATPLSVKRFVEKRQGISHQITRQTASLLQGCEAVISKADGGDPDKGLGLVLWIQNFKLCISKIWKILWEIPPSTLFVETIFVRQDHVINLLPCCWAMWYHYTQYLLSARLLIWKAFKQECCS